MLRYTTSRLAAVVVSVMKKKMWSHIMKFAAPPVRLVRLSSQPAPSVARAAHARTHTYTHTHTHTLSLSLSHTHKPPNTHTQTDRQTLRQTDIFIFYFFGMALVEQLGGWLVGETYSWLICCHMALVFSIMHLYGDFFF